MTKTVYVIEGQNPGGAWVPLDHPFSGDDPFSGEDDDDHMSPDAVATERRTMTIGLLRGRGVTRYKRVRIKKTVTTEEIVGGHHVV